MVKFTEMMYESNQLVIIKLILLVKSIKLLQVFNIILPKLDVLQNP